MARKEIPYPHRPLMLYAAIIIAFVTFLFIFMSRPTSCGQEMGCFLSAANECRSAKMDVLWAGAQVHVVSDDTCALEKTIISVDDRYSHDLFFGKSMTCTYAKGALTQQDVEILTTHLESCDGALKSALYEVALAANELG